MYSNRSYKLLSDATWQELGQGHRRDLSPPHVGQHMSHALADSAGQEEMAHAQMALEKGPILPHRSL